MQLQYYIEILEKLIKIARMQDLHIRIKDFKGSDGLLIDKRIGINSKIPMKDVPFIIAHELAHSYLHYDKGNTINSQNHAEYEEQADRAAHMILDLLNGGANHEENN